MNAPEALRRRLLTRIHDSVEAHREYVTLRRDAGAWREAAMGARVRSLWAGPAARADLWRLDAGAVLPWPAEALGQELLVVGGGLHGAEGVLKRYDHLMHETGSRVALVAGADGAQVHVRQRLAEGAAL
jgi:hypothetical protein